MEVVWLNCNCFELWNAVGSLSQLQTGWWWVVPRFPPGSPPVPLVWRLCCSLGRPQYLWWCLQAELSLLCVPRPILRSHLTPHRLWRFPGMGWWALPSLSRLLWPWRWWSQLLQYTCIGHAVGTEEKGKFDCKLQGIFCVLWTCIRVCLTGQYKLCIVRLMHTHWKYFFRLQTRRVFPME